MCKKYSQYKIMITYLNGDKEELSYKGVNTESYKDMIKFYQDIKKQYINESVLIDFVGVNDNGELGVLFTKKIVTEETKQKELADKVANTRVEDILNDIKENIELLKARVEYCNGQRSVLDKQENIELHKIEHFHNKNWTPEEEILEKIRVFDRLNNIRNARRIAKEDKLIGGQILGYFNMDELNKVKFDHRERAYLDEKKVVQLKIMQEFSYRNFKERINLMKRLEKKYRKVVVDEANMKIICYNNAS